MEASQSIEESKVQRHFRVKAAEAREREVMAARTLFVLEKLRKVEKEVEARLKAAVEQPPR